MREAVFSDFGTAVDLDASLKETGRRSLQGFQQSLKMSACSCCCERYLSYKDWSRTTTIMDVPEFKSRSDIKIKRQFRGCEINGAKHDTSSWWLSKLVFLAEDPESKSENLKCAFRPLSCQLVELHQSHSQRPLSESSDRRRKNILHFLLRFQGRPRQIDVACALENLSCSPMVKIMYDCN